MEWWSGGVMEWWSGGVVEWWSGGVVEWWRGGGVEWWSDGFYGTPVPRLEELQRGLDSGDYSSNSILIVCVTGTKAAWIAWASGWRSFSVWAATPSMSVLALALRKLSLICLV